MKRIFCITGKGDNGIKACLSFETEAEWVPLDAENVGAMEEFIPEMLYEVICGDELGSRNFLVQVTDRQGMDWRRRRSVKSLVKHEFLSVSG